MINFSKTFITSNGAYTFLFYKVEGHTMHKYFVAVETNAKRVAGFDIKLDKEGQWKVIAPAPEFAMQEEARLIAVIEENSKPFFK